MKLQISNRLHNLLILLTLEISEVKVNQTLSRKVNL